MVVTCFQETDKYIGKVWLASCELITSRQRRNMPSFGVSKIALSRLCTDKVHNPAVDSVERGAFYRPRVPYTLQSQDSDFLICNASWVPIISCNRTAPSGRGDCGSFRGIVRPFLGSAASPRSMIWRHFPQSRVEELVRRQPVRERFLLSITNDRYPPKKGLTAF